MNWIIMGLGAALLLSLLRLWRCERQLKDWAEHVNGVMGLTGEAGEVVDIVKKGIFHGKGVDMEHLKKELGDVMWYVALICESCGWELDDVMQTNVDKLKKRYPEGFSEYRANHREEGDI